MNLGGGGEDEADANVYAMQDSTLKIRTMKNVFDAKSV
jgi:hypothetical protein